MIQRPWPVLHQKALYGLVGEVVETLLPHTEADPAGLAIDFLTVFGVMAGNAVAPWPHILADGAVHTACLNPLLIGETARARKSTAYLQIRRLFDFVDRDFFVTQTPNGFGSGEAVIEEVVEAPDKRLLIFENEFSRLLIVAQRRDSILSSVIRQTWDGDTLSVRTRSKKVVAEGPAHIAVIGHITAEELLSKAGNGTEAANGFLNRFLHVCVRRSKILPSGGEPDEQVLRELSLKVNRRLKMASEVGALARSVRADRYWSRLYRAMVADDPGGVLGHVIARSEAQLLRLCVAYALTDGSPCIKVHHVKAAKAIWDYCRASAAYVYGRGHDADLVLDAAIGAGREGITKTAVYKLFGGHRTQSEVDGILKALSDEGVIRTIRKTTAGRPLERIIALDA